MIVVSVCSSIKSPSISHNFSISCRFVNIMCGFFTNKNNFDAYINHHFKITNDTIILNRLDGGSMYIKILSEYGYIGLFLFFLLFYLNRSKRMDNAYSLLNNCLFITILVLFLRTADYVSPILTYIIVVFFFTANDRLATSEEPIHVES